MTGKTGKSKLISRRGFIGASLAAVSAAGLKAKERVIGQVPAVPAQPIVRDKPELKIKEYRTLGRTGDKVSDIGIGGGPLSNASVLRAALDAGECAGCAGPCEAACPYGVPIQAKLLLAHEDLTP